MDRAALWYLCLGLVGVLAIGLAAPALPGAATFVDGDLHEDPAEIDHGEFDSELLEPAPEPDGGGELGIVGLIVIAAAGFLVLLVVARLAIENPRRILGTLVGGGVLLTLLFGLFLADPARFFDGAGAGGTAETFPLVVATIALLLAVVGTVLAHSRPRGTLEAPEIEPRASEREPWRSSPDDHGCGDPPTPSELPDADANEVYRAWSDLAERVADRTTRNATPREIAGVAVDAGMDSDAVDRLTGLFETVRYGSQEPTPETERQAADFRRALEEDEE